ncbi:MAG: hypothetical protein Q7S27_03865 [Nanoarchaeota archaeon]|nr:hypothetical protein [Nanoarchaeota archaeon]
MDKRSQTYFEISEEKLPALVLAVNREYSFKSGREWISITHQTAGHSCRHEYMFGTILRPKDDVLESMKVISNHWFNSLCGQSGIARLSEILKYREQINELFNADCERTYTVLKEGMYPMDCSSELVRKLSTDEIPEDLDDFIIFKNDIDRIRGIMGRWNLYILSENCD